MPDILVTAPVFQAPMFWLKALAKENMYDISLTAPVFQAPMFWLKALA